MNSKKTTILFILILISFSCKNKERISNSKAKEFKLDSFDIKVNDANGEIQQNSTEDRNQVKIIENDSLKSVNRDNIELELIHLNDSIIQIGIKNNDEIQEIMYKPYSISGNNIINYSNKIDLHNDYDVIMADYNFDNRIDFAILYDKTINTGTVFTYFFQSENGKFFIDKNFPLSLIPTDIKKIRH